MENETQVKEEAVTVDSEKEQVVEEQQEEQQQDKVVEEEASTFTQEQVNEVVRTRLEKERSRLYSRYGVTDKNGLDELFNKAQAYELIKEKFDSISGENNSLKERLAFRENNINPEKQEDIKAYFKGKNIEFNDENLKTELATHNEWVKTVEKPKTTIQSLGNDKNTTKPKVDERDLAMRMFGLNGFSK